MGLLDDAIREHLELKRRRGADAGELSRAESEALGPVRRSPDGTPDLTSIPPPQTASPPSAEPVGLHDDYGAEHDWADETAIVPAASDTSHEPPPVASAYEPPATSGYEPPAMSGYEPPAAYEPPPPAPYEPPPIPVAPDPGYIMPPALPPPGYDEHPPGFEDLDEEPPLEEPPAPPPREKPRLRLRLRRGGGDAAPPPPPPSSFDGHDPSTAAHEPPPAYPPPPAYAPPPAHERDAPPAGEPAGEDLLEETPEFLEETPDHDRLWFEQRPPRDFDFDK